MPPKEEAAAAVKVVTKTKEERIATISGSLRTYKGHLTRNPNTLRAILKGLDDRGPGPSPVQELTRLMSKIDEYREKSDALYIQLMGLDQDREAEFQASMDRDAATIDELIAVTLIVLESATTPASFQTVPAIPRAKPNTALNPNVLKRDDLPITMRAWIEQYEAYHRTSHLDTLPNKDQQAYFLTLLDSSLRARIKASLTDETPVLPTTTDQDSGIEACGPHHDVDCDYRHMDATAQYRVLMY